MHGAGVAQWREVRRERRHRHLGNGLRRPAAMAVHHAERPRQAIERELGGALVEHLTVDIARLLGGEED